jgi:hypothetical protein
VNTLVEYQNYLDQGVMRLRLQKIHGTLRQFVETRFGAEQVGRPAQPFEAHARRALADIGQLLAVSEPQLPAKGEPESALTRLQSGIRTLFRKLFGGGR